MKISVIPHELKDQEFREVRVFGSDTVVRLLHPKKASSEIEVTPS